MYNFGDRSKVGTAIFENGDHLAFEQAKLLVHPEVNTYITLYTLYYYYDCVFTHISYMLYTDLY